MRQNLRLAWVAVVTVTTLWASTVPAMPEEASREAEIQKEKAALKEKIQLAEKRAKAFSQEIAAGDSRRTSLEKQIASLNAQLRGSEQRLKDVEAELGVARTDLSSAEEKLAALQSRMQLLQKRLEARTRLAYKVGGMGRYLEMLLGADDFRDFFSRLSFVRSVVIQDRSQVDSIKNLAQQLESAKAQAAERRNQIALQKTALEDEKKNVAVLQKGVQTNRQKVVGEIAARRGLLSEVQNEKAAYLREMQRLEAESRSIAALLKNRQRGQVFNAGAGKKLAWPTTGSVSSSFGHRTHPVFGDRRMHNGIDIAAPSGQATIAADSGTVVFAGAKGGYGNTVIIDHGNAFATLYAHLSAISVSSGATVARSARVGAVGCTGYCTGPHLHFETRVNGQPVNPMQFF